MSQQFNVDSEIVNHYLDNGHSWTGIAIMLRISTKTLLDWRHRTNFIDLRTPFDADEVDEIIRKYVEGQPQIGETQIIGHIKANYNIKGSRDQFRASIGRVDPFSLWERREQFGRKIVRRVYDIIAPHKLWHLDGWHKLIRYGIIVFACVDGGTRTLVYAGVSNNNRATNHMRY